MTKGHRFYFMKKTVFSTSKTGYSVNDLGWNVRLFKSKMPIAAPSSSVICPCWLKQSRFNWRRAIKQLFEFRAFMSYFRDLISPAHH